MNEVIDDRRREAYLVQGCRGMTTRHKHMLTTAPMIGDVILGVYTIDTKGYPDRYERTLRCQRSHDQKVVVADMRAAASALLLLHREGGNDSPVVTTRTIDAWDQHALSDHFSEVVKITTDYKDRLVATAYTSYVGDNLTTVITDADGNEITA